MNRQAGKIVCMLLLLLLWIGNQGIAQVVSQSRDTLRGKAVKTEAVEEGKAKGKSQNEARPSSQGEAGNSQNAVKQIKGSRPDMSKARGARPPVIVRPAGSGIPKGIGRPGGAGKRGGR